MDFDLFETVLPLYVIVTNWFPYKELNNAEQIRNDYVFKILDQACREGSLACQPIEESWGTVFKTYGKNNQITIEYGCSDYVMRRLREEFNWLCPSLVVSGTLQIKRKDLAEFLRLHNIMPPTGSILYDWFDQEPKPESNGLYQVSEGDTQTNIQPEYLNDDHAMYSQELDIAIQAWVAVLKDKPPRPKKGSRKQLIENWLEGFCKDNPEIKLTKAAKDRITAMLNPDDKGGAPKSTTS